MMAVAHVGERTLEVSELKAIRPRFVVVAAAVLLLVVAAGGCNRSTDRTATPASPAASAPPSATDPGGQASAGGSADASVPEVDTASAPPPPASAAVVGTAAAPPTPDAVASELDQIQQLIDDINGSLTGSDSQGGE